MRIMQSLVVLAALALPIAAMATPVSYDPVTQFNGVTNSGIWTYGYGAVGTTPTLLPDFNNSLFTNESNWNLNQLPGIGLGGFTNGSVDAPSSDLWMHPGNDDSQAAILIFTAQTDGIYYFSGLFERDDTSDGSGYGTDVSIYEDSTTLLFGSTALGTTYLDSASFSGAVSLVAGETLDFEVARTPGTNYYNDSTGLQLNISQTPEPSSLILLGTGLLGVVGIGRRKLAKV